MLWWLRKGAVWGLVGNIEMANGVTERGEVMEKTKEKLNVNSNPIYERLEFSIA